MRSCAWILLFVSTAGISFSAQAHTGHGTETLFSGLTHPLGWDHLLAMVAVGIWSTVALATGRRLLGPLVFMTGLLAGAAAGVMGLGLPLVEPAIAITVSIFGALLLVPRALPAPAGLTIVAIAATLHGLAHGAEFSAGSSFAVYSAGFLATTALLHGVGLGFGELMARARQWVWNTAAAGFGVAGLLLVS